ncbi:hypothetical protein BJV77DRAFT_963939 [Russula vinacea]|nr:hypothetical protein BJV77DRAFT_963939 [Russula vinacea]
MGWSTGQVGLGNVTVPINTQENLSISVVIKALCAALWHPAPFYVFTDAEAFSAPRIEFVRRQTFWGSFIDLVWDGRCHRGSEKDGHLDHESGSEDFSGYQRTPVDGAPAVLSWTLTRAACLTHVPLWPRRALSSEDSVGGWHSFSTEFWAGTFKA